MTAKEKAIELVKKCSRYACMGRFECKYHRHENAKKLALILVDEAIEYELRIVEQVEYLCTLAERGFKCEGLFWEEVKREILAI